MNILDCSHNGFTPMTCSSGVLSEPGCRSGRNEEAPPKSPVSVPLKDSVTSEVGEVGRANCKNSVAAGQCRCAGAMKARAVLISFSFDPKRYQSANTRLPLSRTAMRYLASPGTSAQPSGL